MDELVCQHFAADFKERFQVDALAQPRATLRLRQASEKVRRVLAKHRYTIHPSGKYMTYWDPITTLSLLFVAIVTPAEIAFTINEDVDPNTFLFWVNRCIDLVFLKDM